MADEGVKQHQFQDYCKNCSLIPGYYLYGCKKDVLVIMSFKAQTTKNKQKLKNCKNVIQLNSLNIYPF